MTLRCANGPVLTSEIMGRIAWEQNPVTRYVLLTIVGKRMDEARALLKAYPKESQ